MIADHRVTGVWWAAAIMGLLAVATTALPWHDAVNTTQTAAPVLAFLVGVAVLAELSDAAGLFELLARRTARLSGGSTRRLFLLVCLLASVVTILLSLDTTAVLLTPVVLALAAAVDTDVRPFAFAAVWLANAASLLLPVSNLTNLLAATRLGSLGEVEFARRMLLPEVVAIAVVTLVLMLRFRTSLRRRHAEPEPYAITDRPLVVVAAACCLAVAPASLFGVAPWTAALPAAAVLAAVFAVRRRTVLRTGLVPWRLVLLTEGLFLVVAALGHHGLDSLLTHVTRHGALPTELLGAGGANVANNLPTYLAVQRTVPPHHVTDLLALLIGTNAGPLLLLFGSLATLLWRDRCTARGLRIGAWEFFRTGLLVVPPLLLGCYGALLITS
ncbi:MAG TPA: SLC13 family permease [Mycobacteriales bacterium]